MTHNQKRSRIVYLDGLRIAATLAVILLHLAASHWGDIDVYSGQWNVFNLWNSLVRWAVPVFVMISGALFLRPEVQVPTRKIYSKYVLRIVTVYVFWTVLYGVYAMLPKDRPTIPELVSRLITGPYHLWFLFMIIGLYLIVPLVRAITADAKLTRYFLLLAFVTVFLTSTFTMVAEPLVSGSGESMAKTIYEAICAAGKSAAFHFPFGYVSYFMLGYVLSEAKLTRRQKYLVYVLAIAGFLATAGGTAWMSRHLGRAYGLYDNFGIGVLFESIGVFVLAKQLAARKMSSAVSGGNDAVPVNTDCSRNRLRFVADHTFGIFLVHVLLIDLMMNQLKISTLSFSAVLSVPLLTLGIFSVGLGISIVLRRIPIVGKYIV